MLLAVVEGLGKCVVKESSGPRGGFLPPPRASISSQALPPTTTFMGLIALGAPLRRPYSMCSSKKFSISCSLFIIGVMACKNHCGASDG